MVNANGNGNASENGHNARRSTSQRIKETGKARWQRFLHGGKWQVGSHFQACKPHTAMYFSLTGLQLTELRQWNC